jgi:hypothetical protein
MSNILLYKPPKKSSLKRRKINGGAVEEQENEDIQKVIVRSNIIIPRIPPSLQIGQPPMPPPNFTFMQGADGKISTDSKKRSFDNYMRQQSDVRSSAKKRAADEAQRQGAAGEFQIGSKGDADLEDDFQDMQ